MESPRPCFQADDFYHHLSFLLFLRFSLVFALIRSGTYILFLSLSISKKSDIFHHNRDFKKRETGLLFHSSAPQFISPCSNLFHSALSGNGLIPFTASSHGFPSRMCEAPCSSPYVRTRSRSRTDSLPDNAVPSRNSLSSPRAGRP